MNPFENDNLPLLTEIVETASSPNKITSLNSINAPTIKSESALTHDIPLSEAQLLHLQAHLVAHFESILTEKLNRHFEHLHHQAVKLAISELKDELPELLRNVLRK